jgi:hypothetical protein
MPLGAYGLRDEKNLSLKVLIDSLEVSTQLGLDPLNLWFQRHGVVS